MSLRSWRVGGGITVAMGLLAACASITAAPLDREDSIDAAIDSTRADALPPPDSAFVDATAPDVGTDADAAPVVLKRISGHVDYNGPIANAIVTTLAPTAMNTITDTNGDFVFYLPLGSTAVFKVTAPNLYPMIRGLVVADANRIRNFYLAGPPEQAAAQSLGLGFDVTKGIVEVDFRNAAVGGYSVVLKSGLTTVTPGFGIALDAMGAPQASVSTLTGGDGSTLLLGNVAPLALSFAPNLPDAGLMACKPCDAPTLPVQAGVVTWFDFECGSATDCR